MLKKHTAILCFSLLSLGILAACSSAKPVAVSGTELWVIPGAEPGAEPWAPNIAVTAFTTDASERNQLDDVRAIRELAHTITVEFGRFRVMPDNFVDDFMVFHEVPPGEVTQYRFYDLFSRSDISFVLSGTVSLDAEGYKINFTFVKMKKREYYQSANIRVKKTGRNINAGIRKAIPEFLRSIPLDSSDFDYSEGAARFAIGDRGPAGGTIFYVKGNHAGGWRYLEAAPADIATMLPWGFSFQGTVVPDAPGTNAGLGEGKHNTDMLYSDRIPADKLSAAQACKTLHFNGFSDWYLPSRDELDLLYQTLSKDGKGNFKDAGYWSSTQSARGAAWFQMFGDGKMYVNGLITDTFYVRPVRSF
ncbi:MAG: DUF1566 domain-containing protein [Spirochaetaceae bacterium]|nr:DUF1566 domain-containing protein [Spirochaetaceae bacterium]